MSLLEQLSHNLRIIAGFHHREQHEPAVVLLGKPESNACRFKRLAALINGEQNGVEHGSLCRVNPVWSAALQAARTATGGDSVRKKMTGG